MKRGLSTIGILLVSAVLMGQTASPFAGTWKVNLEKSSYSPGKPPVSSTSRIEAIDGGLKDINDTVDAAGKRTHTEWTAKFDGKDYPITGDPGRDAVSIQQIDGYSYEVQNKKSGRVLTTARIVIASDGKSRTVTTAGLDPSGQKINNVVVSEKQ